MRLNLILLLLVSFLPFTTAIVATHLFASNLTLHEVTVSSSSERVAVVLFGLNLTLLLQASATVVGAFLPLLAVIFYLALAIFYLLDPVRLVRTHGPGRARIKGMSAGN